MNILKDRSVWIVIFVIILSGLYYWTVVDSERVEGMKTLEESDFDLSGDVTEWSEAYKRLELKWRGTSKHVKTLQNVLVLEAYHLNDILLLMKICKVQYEYQILQILLLRQQRLY